MTRLSDAPTFQPTDFVDRLLAADERPIAALGVASRTLVVAQDDLRRVAADRGLDLVLVDCATSEHALAQAIRNRLQDLQSQRRAGAATLRLAEAVDRAERGSPQARTEGLARLWKALVALHPVLLLVVNAGSSSDDDAALLRYFSEHVYTDPVGALIPEDGAWAAPAGRFVLVDFESEFTSSVDFGEDAESAVRAYLATDEVVRRFMASTEGDLTRLDELVGDLPENASHLALFRYERLSAPERAIADTLAVAGEPMAPDHLHDAVALLGVSEYFARSLRHLEDAGILRRSMGSGRIVVALDDAGFGAALRARIAGDAARFHRAIADAERARHEGQADPALLARHYAAAGDFQIALEVAPSAIARLRRERRFPAARRLIEALLESADQTDALELDLASVLEEMGEYQAALDACSRVESEDATLELQRGRLSARIGHWEDARVAFARVLGDADASEAHRRDAMLGRADAEYALGDHDTAVAHLETLIESLEGDDAAPSMRDRALLSARNTLGKIAIVRSQFADAIDMFETNRELAVRWGWDDEVARAQANLGVVALQRDDHVEALERLSAALESSDERGSLPRAYCLMNIATVHQRRDNYELALENCLEAMRCAKMVGDQNAYAVATRNLATIYQDVGDYGRALSLLDHLRERYEADVQSLGGGWNLLVRGQLQLDTGDLEGAEETFEELRTARLAPVFGTPAALRLAEIQKQLGHATRAQSLLEDAQLGERPLFHGLAGLLKAELVLEESAERALEIARVAWETLDEVGQKDDTVRARIAIADALVALGRDAEARTELQRELARVREVAANVPQEFTQYFWKKPANRELVSRLQALSGEVPASCIVAEPVLEPEVAAPVETAEFRAWRSRYSDIVGRDEKLLQVFRLIDKVANSNATVLAYGESGTGKELVASAMHAHSDRRGKPFVKVNCGAFVENLLLSELFGHEKGAFTGANERKLGRFERAQGGTIFLDEIGDISPNTQVALLRVLQEGTFERVGGTETLQSDVRVVCATNKDLEEMVKRGEFRLDLYYRLKGVVIELPALRERRGDIALLANHFASTLAADGPKHFSADALQFLSRYSWPGNIRELQNFVRSIVLFVESPTIDREAILEFRDFFVSGEIDETLPDVELPETAQAASVEDEAVESEVSEVSAVYAGQSPEDALAEQIVSEGRSLSDIKKRLETECIKRALIATGGNVTQAADILQMKRPRLSQIINADEELSALKTRLAG